MSGVVVCGLSKSYGPVRALRGIDLVVEPGDFTVLLGPSGCGKSTLLNAIAGLDDIDAGTVAIGGVEVTQREPSERGIAMVFQSYALYPTMTVRRNLSFGLRVRSVPKAEIKRRVAWVSELLQIGGSRSDGRWCSRPRCFCSTSHCPISMPSYAPKCGSS
jgi:multiple sugar transport system ATP-binding protein